MSRRGRSMRRRSMRGRRRKGRGIKGKEQEEQRVFPPLNPKKLVYVFY